MHPYPVGRTVKPTTHGPLVRMAPGARSPCGNRVFLSLGALSCYESLECYTAREWRGHIDCLPNVDVFQASCNHIPCRKYRLTRSFV